jgi:two-component system nitrogen regulation response regulator GlnG
MMQQMATKPLNVWLVDDDASIRWVLERALKQGGMVPTAFEQADSALAALRRSRPDVLMTDIRMPGRSGLELLAEIRDSQPELPVIVMTAHSDLDSAVAAYQGGAFEYLPSHLISIRQWIWCAAPPTRKKSPRKSRPIPNVFPKCSARRRPCRKCFAPLVACRVPA